MLLIVAHHYVVNSGLTSAAGPVLVAPMSGKSIFLLLWGAWGKTGINCFVLISGYFMCKSRITVKKFARLLGEVVFYRVVINSIFWLTGYAPFSLEAALKALLPVTSIGTGFTPAYLVFFLSIPFLNILIRHMTEKQHIRLLLLSSFTYIFLGTLPFFSVTMNYVSWFIVLYFIAAYIRLYPKKLFENRRFWGWAALGSMLLSAASVVAGAWVYAKSGRNLVYYFVTDSNTLLAVLTGVSSFMFFKNLKMKHHGWINTISATTFGVLLIHANSDAMRQWLWKDVLNNVGMYDSPWLPLHAIGSVLVIFAVCSVIDLLRIHLIEAPCFRLWDRHWDGIAQRYQQFEQRICAKLSISQDATGE